MHVQSALQNLPGTSLCPLVVSDRGGGRRGIIMMHQESKAGKVESAFPNTSYLGEYSDRTKSDYAIHRSHGSGQWGLSKRAIATAVKSAPRVEITLGLGEISPIGLYFAHTFLGSLTPQSYSQGMVSHALSISFKT